MDQSSDDKSDEVDSYYPVAGVATEHNGEEESSVEGSTQTLDDDGTGFAAQLRKQRKQVLEKDSSTNDFANALRRHREHLVDAWEDNSDDQDKADSTSNNVFTSGDTTSDKTFFPVLESSERRSDIAEKVENDPTMLPSSDDALLGKCELHSDEIGSDPLFYFDSTKSSPKLARDNDDDDDNDNESSNDATAKNHDGVGVLDVAQTFEQQNDHFDAIDESKLATSQCEPTSNSCINGVVDADLHYIETFETQAKSPAHVIDSFEEQISGTITSICANDEGDYNSSVNADPTNAESPVNSNENDTKDSKRIEFGDFDNALSQPESRNNLNKGDGVDIGDFGTAPTLLSQHSEGNTAPLKPAPSKALTENDIDIFGDCNATQPLSVQPIAEDGDKDDDDGNEFNDLDATPTETEEANIVNQDDVDEFKDLDVAPTLSSHKDDNEGDIFGDFGAAPSQLEGKDEIDFFGQFGAAPTLSPKPIADVNKDVEEGNRNFDAAPSQHEATKIEGLDYDNDFGDFDAAPTLSAQPAPEESDKKDYVCNIFGDFDAASPQPEASKGANEDHCGGFGTSPTLSAQPAVGDSDKIDDKVNVFSDFGAAPSQPEAPYKENKDDDDNFGDTDAAPTLSVQPIGEGNCKDEEGNGFGAFDANPTKPEALNNMNGDGDDFGDFGAAPTFSSQPAVEELEASISVGKDGFGDFGAAPTLSSQPAVEEPGVPNSVGEDGFGDFGTAPTLPSQRAVEELEESTFVSEDDSGDFGAAPTLSSQPAVEEPEVANSVGEDDFGDFGAAPTLSSQPAVEELEASRSVSEDDFGNFGAAPTSSSQPAVEEPEVSNSVDKDDFGDFGAAPTLSSQPAVGELKASTSVDKDDFGDFGAAPALSSQPAMEELEASTSVNEDDFGDFGAAPALSSQPAMQEPKSLQSDNEDDFGDFGAAPTFSAQPFAEDGNKKNEGNGYSDFDASPSQPEVSNNLDEDEDNFGDFDAAPTMSVQTAEDSDKDNGEVNEFGYFDAVPLQPAVSDEVDEDEDFGDFDAAPTMSVQPVVEDRDKDNNEDNESGDFGDFDTTLSQLQAPGDVHVDEIQDDDDFGDFDAAPSLSTQPGVEDGNEFDEGNEFGDFDTAPSQPEASNTVNQNESDFDAAPTLSVQPFVEDSDKSDEGNNFGDFDTSRPQPEASNNAYLVTDDDDDFGAFDAAPTSFVKPVEGDGGRDEDRGDDFGDFDAAPSNPEASSSNLENLGGCVVNSEGSVNTLPPIGRVNNDKRNIFAKMQALHSFLDSDSHKNTGCDNLFGEESVTNFLASSRSVECIEGPQESNLDQLFRDSPTSTKQNTISVVKGDGRGPYDCFVYPLGGLRACHGEFKNEIPSRRNISTPIPDMLPIRLSPRKEMPLNTASPVNGHHRKIKAVNLSNLDVAGFDKSSPSKKTSNYVENFRSKIPDLSFMLQSHLKLPANAVN